MGDYEKDMIERCKRAIRGGYPIALGKHDTGLFILGLREIKRRNRWLRSFTYTYIQAEIKELRARRSYTEGVVLRLHDEDIRLLIKAIKLGARRKKAKGTDCLELTWGEKMQNALTDIEQDLVIERALTQQLKDTLSERESHICDLSYALRTSQTELKKQRDSFDTDVLNINTLCTDLLEICSKSPIDEAEARRRALALSRIALGRMQ